MRVGDLLGAGEVLLNLNNAQSRFGNLVTQLSSGLRINTAADDPSGYAIATNLQTKSASLAQGTNSIQEANNLLNVANGAMTQITALIDRMHTLVVEANSDLNSTSDLANIQSEINQLLLEINRISQNTNFNGKALLDGSLTSTPPTNTDTVVYAFNPSSDGTTVPSGPLIEQVNVTPGAPPVAVNFTVNSYDPTTNLVTVTYTAESNAAGFGPPQTTTFQVTAGTNYPAIFPFPPPEPVLNNVTNQSGSYQYVSFEFANVTANDVGQSAAFTWTPAQNYTAGSGLNVNTGDAEGSTINVQIGAMDAYNLGIGSVSVGDTLTNQASEALLNNALQMVTTQEAQVGAQTVALGVAATNNETYNVNISASASEITDLNVGQASTQYAQAQILVNVGTSVLAQMQTGETQLTALLIRALVA